MGWVAAFGKWRRLRLLVGGLALLSAMAPRPVTAGEPRADPAGHLLLDAGWRGYLVLDREEVGPGGEPRLVAVEEIAKVANESRFLTLPPGRYHLFRARPRNQAQAVVTVYLRPGAVAVVQAASFVPLVERRAEDADPVPRPVPGPVPRMVRPPRARALYPRTAAARPLTLPPMMGEVALDVTATWLPSPPARLTFDATRLRSRASIVDRLEARGLGVYGAILAPRSPPEGEEDRRTELAAGGGIGGFGGALLNLNGTSAAQLGLDATIDLKQHLRRAVAVQAELTGGVHLPAFGSISPDVALGGYLELQLDVARIVSLLINAAAQTGRMYLAQTGFVPGHIEAQHAILPTLGLQVAPLSWLELGLAAGPRWFRSDALDWQLSWVAVGRVVLRI